MFASVTACGPSGRTARRIGRAGPAALVVLVLTSTLASATEFRRSAPIRTPDTIQYEIGDEVNRACVPAPCVDLRPVEQAMPVRKATIRRAMNRIAEAWNTPALREHLAESFFDKSRLLDTLREAVPRDARLRILGVGNVQVLAQFVQPASGSRPRSIVSVVSARVATQVQFNDPGAGFVRSKRATQEYVFVLTETSEG